MSDTPDVPNLNANVSLYPSAEVRDSIGRDNPALTRKNSMILGWAVEPGSDDVDVDIVIAGIPPRRDELVRAANILHTISHQLLTDAGTIDDAVTGAEFEQIVEHEGDEDEELPSAEELLADPRYTKHTCPGWAKMTDLDRALALEHLEATSRGEAHELVYAEDEDLLAIPADLAHEHALFLVESMGVPDTLSADERERYASLLADHRENHVDADDSDD